MNPNLPCLYGNRQLIKPVPYHIPLTKPIAMSQDIQDFLKELDRINDSPNPEKYERRTRDLLAEGDAVFEASTNVKKRIADGSFQRTISGQTYIEEYVEENKNQIRKERPVVDLVQQGGTMLGIGLLGYTYVMEKAGVRFRSMAGTSAGAINTLLLAALPQKIYSEQSPIFKDGRQALKSEFLAYLVANKEFIEFIDRQGTLRKVQHWLLKRIKVVGKILPYFLMAIPFMILGMSALFYWLMNRYLFRLSNGLQESEIKAYDFILGTLGISAAVLFLLLLVFRLFKNTMGVNPGERVYEWMKAILDTNYVNVTTTKALLDGKKEPKPMHAGVKMESEPRLVFIAANLTHNRIVKFPECNGDYWAPDCKDLVCPAAYVRASMSLPFIFHSFIPDEKHVQCAANTAMPVKPVQMLARFIDGGMLSNFPIREFHVPKSAVPPYPTFGVLLGGPPADPTVTTPASDAKFKSLSVFRFILSFISTFRTFYDKDFLTSHPELKHIVQAVDTSAFNSLDFAMNDKTRQLLFRAGAETAIKQLETFDWDTYLKVRMA